MIAIIAIVVIVLIIYMISKKKKKPVVVVEDEEEEVCVPDSELTGFVVYHKGIPLSKGEVVEIPYNKYEKFCVEGRNLENKCVAIEGSKVNWGKSCGCTHWEAETELCNSVRTNNKSLNIKRNVWVKYSNGVSFGWKVEVF